MIYVSTHLDKIIDILDVQYNIQTELLELSKSKTEVLLAEDVKKLGEITKSEQELIKKLETIELQRQKQVEMISKERGLSNNTITISELIEDADDLTKDRLRNIKGKLSSIISEQSSVNDINRQLVKANLEYLSFSLSFLTGQLNSGTVYDKDAKSPKNNGSSGIFDKSV